GWGAYRFVDFLRGARQRYWLMLPHNPTDDVAAYSPYSTRSAMAGNTLLISLDEFQRQGWITKDELAKNRIESTAHVAYGSAKALKQVLFGKAFRNYLQQWNGTVEPGFSDFCAQEASWLEDYADYVVLHKLHHGKPWYEWPLAYRHREKEAMAGFKDEHVYELQQVKWLQYQFHVQWHNLRTYARCAGVKFIGDLPYYISHDSADVWA